MKAIVRKSLKNLSEERVLAAIDAGYDVGRLMIEYGATPDAFSKHFIKSFGRDRAMELIKGLAENKEKKKASTMVTITLRSGDDPKKEISVSGIIDGQSSVADKREKIDHIFDMLAERVSDQMLEQHEQEPDDDFDFSAMDETIGQAVLSRVREQQLRRELQELFDKEDSMLAEVELSIKNAMLKRDDAAIKISDINAELRSCENERSALEIRIGRCQENLDWGLPRRKSDLHRKATDALSRLNSCSGKNREKQEKKYSALLTEIENCESEIKAAAEKLARLNEALETLRSRIAMLTDEKSHLKDTLKDVDSELKKLEAQKKKMLQARFYLKMYEEGVSVTTRNVENDLVSDDIRPMTDPEISGSMDWTDKLRTYEEKTGKSLSSYDIVALVRILYLAPKQKQGYEIVYGEGTEYLSDTITYFLGRK